MYKKKILESKYGLRESFDLPIIVHNREATEDVVQILKEEKAEEVGGIMHCFSGSPEIAKALYSIKFLYFTWWTSHI